MVTWLTWRLNEDCIAYTFLEDRQRMACEAFLPTVYRGDIRAFKQQHLTPDCLRNR